MEEPRSGCPINAAVEVLGDHWSLLVLRDVIFGDRRYFRELHAGSIEGIASNILADRLKKLVAAGLLSREDAVRGARARYSLTEAGIQTLPIIFALGNWGLDWRDGTSELRIRQELMRDEGHRLRRGWRSYPSCCYCLDDASWCNSIRARAPRSGHRTDQSQRSPNC